MFVNPCFYFEELFPTAPGEVPGTPDDAVRPADAAPLPLGECEPETEGVACSH